MVTTPAPTAGATRADRTVRRSLRARLLVGLLSAATGLLRRLPDRLLHRAAAAAGRLLYRLAPKRRALVRANLGRVCGYLVEQRLVEPDTPPARAVSDEKAMEHLVRSAFEHYVRAYLETAIVAAYAQPGRDERISVDDPALVEQAFGSAGAGDSEVRGVIVVALHLGAIELPALWATRRGLRVTAPMETLANSELQGYLERSRGAAGLRLVPTRGAGRELTDALARGEIVALVADRLVSGSGARVELFGAETRLPLGPAALALETGLPTWLVAVRRTDWGSYSAHLERVELPGEGTRRERLAGFLAAQVGAYERAIAMAPEQWWTLFFPIWPADGAQVDQQ